MSGPGGGPPESEHVPGFPGWDEETQYVHLIEHGHMLDQLRRLSADELAMLHRASHPDGAGDNFPAPPDLSALASKAVQMAAGMREHVHEGRWPEAYACSDWLLDLANEIKSHVWAAHPDARPESW